MPRLRRRTQRERLGEWPPLEKLFRKERRRARVLVRVRQKIKERTLWQPEAQTIIGDIREQKVLEALQSLQKKGEIRDFLPVGKFSYADLIEGVDFVFVYVTDCRYRFCFLSVTGERWVEDHKRRHPEIPVLPVEIWEEGESIESKILALKNFR